MQKSTTAGARFLNLLYHSGLRQKIRRVVNHTIPIQNPRASFRLLGLRAAQSTRSRISVIARDVPGTTTIHLLSHQRQYTISSLYST